jgi:diaminohydroxyphosphoribosylaminopyrimidine deaminase/5-amino-6-(5-phosphoribosylamino)uracil reductase
VHHGRGLERLLAAGLEVDLHEAEDDAALLERFAAQLARRRPHVLAKWAMSRDGAIAPARGGRVAVSSPESQALVHRWRAHADALVVGVNTVIADDPLLTARGDIAPRRTLRRVVLDPSLRTPLSSRVVNTPDQAPTWIVAADDAAPAAEAALVARGAVVLRVPRGPDWLAAGLERLATQGCGRVLVEGGSHTLASLLAADAVDQVAIFMAPRSLGDDGLPAVRGYRLGRLSPHEVGTALALRDCRVQSSGVDTLLRGFRH